MSRYHFHLFTPDEYIVDDIGIELADSNRAYLEAVKGAREVSIEMLREGQSVLSCRFEVVDSQGRLIHAVPFSEALGRSVAGRPAVRYDAQAARGYELAGDLAREIEMARQHLATCRQLSAVSNLTPNEQ